MERLLLILNFVTLSCGWTTVSTPGFGQMDNSMFWGAGMGMAPTSTPSPFMPMYETVQSNGQQTGVGNEQKMMEEYLRLVMQNNINQLKNKTQDQNGQTQSDIQNQMISQWLAGNSNPISNDQTATLNAQMNMMQLQNSMNNKAGQQNNVMLEQLQGNPMAQGSVGPQQGLASLYKAYLTQMIQQTAPTTTTTTPTPTPSPTISAYTPPPMYDLSKGRTPSPTKTLAEIIMEKLMNQNETKKQAKQKTEGPGCFYEGKWYSKLSEISKGQSGDWCYGTYCNHEGVIVHWDDHKCTQKIVKTTPSAPPTSTIPGGGALGCYYNGRWYDPGADILNSRNMDTCYGSYCDFNSKVVHWEDKCYATVPPVSNSGGMSGMTGMDGMAAMAAMGGEGLGGMGGMTGGGGMTGMAGMDGMTAMAALNGDGLAGMSGMAAGGAGTGGMYGMGGMGGMAGQPGGAAAATLDLLKKKKR